MQNRRQFLVSASFAGPAAAAQASDASTAPDRVVWLRMVDKVARPVLTAFAKRQLKATMPVEGKTADRPEYTHLEALGRTLTGIAPWLELRHAADDPLRSELAGLARAAIDSATDPGSPDYCNFDRGSQIVVDGS